MAKADLNKGLKICSCCKKELPLSAFCKNNSTSDKLNVYCRVCENEKKSKRLREDSSLYLKKQFYDRKYHNQDKRRKVRSLNDQKERRKNLQFKFIEYFRASSYRVIKGQSKSKRILSLLGCSIEEFRKHIESQFQEGMTWENRGRYIENWSIDHIIPFSYFDLTIEENQRICCHYLNCRPIWNYDNLSKNAKLPENYQEIINNIKSKLV